MEGCVTEENLIKNLTDFKKGFYTLYTMINAFCQLLEKEKSVTILHKRNLQYLVTETFEVKIGMLPATVTEIFKFYDNATHNLRRGQILERRHNRTNNFGVEPILNFRRKNLGVNPRKFETIIVTQQFQARH